MKNLAILKLMKILARFQLLIRYYLDIFFRYVDYQIFIMFLLRLTKFFILK